MCPSRPHVPNEPGEAAPCRSAAPAPPPRPSPFDARRAAAPAPPPNAATAPGDSTPLTVVTSTNVYGSIAQAVGGDRVSVESLITDPAADPHSYESTPADAATVAGALVVVLNGEATTSSCHAWSRRRAGSAA